MVRSFRRDPDCIHLSWVVGGEESVEEAYAHSRIEAEAIRAIISRASAALPDRVDPTWWTTLENADEARSYGLAVA